MKVILRQDMQKLGHAGDVVNAKDGHARNYLIPQGLAWEATPQNISRIELEKKKRLTIQEKEKEKMRKLAEELSGVSCTVTAEATEDEQLYGSVGAADIARSLETEKNVVIEKQCIMLEQPIKALGIYDVDIKLHPEVITKIRVWVTRK